MEIFQDSLQRNSNPSQGGRSNAFRLTQGFLQSSTQQVILSFLKIRTLTKCTGVGPVERTGAGLRAQREEGPGAAGGRGGGGGGGGGPRQGGGEVQTFAQLTS